MAEITSPYSPQHLEEEDYPGETFPPATPEEREELNIWLARHRIDWSTPIPTVKES